MADLAAQHTTNGEPMTDPDSVKIRLDGRRGTVVVNGYDLSSAVHGFTLRAGADQLPELELDLAIPTAIVSGEADVRVYLTDETKKALIARGWIPPASDEVGAA